jgi:hypothetical protein
MRSRITLACTALLLTDVGSAALSGCSSSSQHPAHEVVPPNPGGIAFGFNEYPDALSIRLQGETGMSLRRVRVPWSEVETVPGRWNWTKADAEYRALLAARLRPLLVAVDAPCWARPARPCSRLGPPDPDFDEAWSEYVRRLVERYPRAVGVEVWNEPNIVPMFPPYPDPERYTALLRAAYEAVKSVDPQLPVISGGLFAADRSGPYGIADAAFLAGIYAAGAGDSMDAIGAHPYPRDPRNGSEPSRYDLGAMERSLDRLRRVRDAAGFSGTPIWITEIGASTAPVRGYPRAVSQAGQAGLLLAALRAARQDGDVQVVLIHRLVDPPLGSPATIDLGFGVFYASGRPKLAACVLSRLFHGSLVCSHGGSP